MTRYRWSATLTLSQPPEQAFVAFTPRGESGWAPEWQPVFHGPADDDSAPGTVFEVQQGSITSVWQVVDRTPGHYLRYARTTPGISAGTVTVTLAPQQDGDRSGSTVHVTYELTALSPQGEAGLAAQAADPDRSPTTWQGPIEEFLAVRRR